MGRFASLKEHVTCVQNRVQRRGNTPVRSTAAANPTVRHSSPAVPRRSQQQQPQQQQPTFVIQPQQPHTAPTVPLRSQHAAVPHRHIPHQQPQSTSVEAVSTTPRTMAKTTSRTTEHPIHPVFTERWSSRSFIPRAMKEETLLTLFDAARWAPSGYNKQPWRFVYVLRQSPEWSKWVDTIVPQNSVWAQNASALILVTSDKSVQGSTFDTGAACANLYTQATFMGIATHPIGGFDREKARTVAKVSDTHNIEAMIVVGFRGEADRLPKELQEREQPSSRNSVSEIANAIEFHSDKRTAVRS